MLYPSGNIYEGMWLNDKKCGLGIMTWKSVDETYTGNPIIITITVINK